MFGVAPFATLPFATARLRFATGNTYTESVSFGVTMGLGNVFTPPDIFAPPDVFYIFEATLNAVGNISLGATHVESPSVTDNMQAAASIAIHPVIAAAGLELMTAPASLSVSSVIATAGGLLQSGSATLTFASAETPLGQLNLTGQGTLAVHPVIAAAGIELMTAPASFTFATAETPTGQLNMTAQASVAVHPAIVAVGGLLMPASASLSFSPVIAALGTETLQLAAALGVSPAIAALGSISYSASAALAVATAIVAAGQITSTKTASLSVTTGLSVSALEIINAAASLAVSTAIAAVGGASYTNTAALNVAAGLTGSSSVTFNLSTAFAETAGIIALAAPMNLTSAAILSTSPAISGAGTFIATGRATIATTTAETPAGMMVMSASSAIALHPAQTDSGALSAILGATLGVISAIGGTVTGSLQGSSGLGGTFTASPNGNISAIVAATLNARPAIDASLGNLFILSMALAVATAESSSSVLTATGQAALSASPAEAAAAAEIMSAAAALNVSPALAASASDVMTAAAIIFSAFIEAGLLDAGGANYTSTAALSGTFGSSAAPSVNMLTALFLASSVAQAGSGAVGASVSTTLTTQPGTSAAGLLTVTGSMSLPAGMGIATPQARGELFPDQFDLTAPFWTADIISGVTVTPGVADPFGRSRATTLTVIDFGFITFNLPGRPGTVSQNSVWLRRRSGTGGSVELWKNDDFNQLLDVTNEWQLFEAVALPPYPPDGKDYFELDILLPAGDAVDIYRPSMFESGGTTLDAGARATFSATFDAEAGNILDATAAVSLATRLATIAVLLSSEPAVDSVAARGVWQGTIDLAGVYEALKTISGIVPGGDLAGRLAGEQALTGVVDLTIDLE